MLARTKCLILSAAFALLTAMPVMACTSPPDAGALAQKLLHQINAERMRYGLQRFKMSSKLGQVARMHACDNARQNRLSHFGTDGSSPGARIFRAGYRFDIVTENVAIGYRTPAQVLKAWLHSSSHRKNILEPKTDELGLAVAMGRDGRRHWVMNGGRR